MLGSRKATVREFARRWSLAFRRIGPEPYPAGFNNWLGRTSNKLKADYPDEWWRQLVDASSSGSPIAVVVHVYYPELLDELLERTSRIPVPVDVLITNATGGPLGALREMPNAVSLRVFDVPNRGRDILPLALLVNAGLLDPYELVLKLHTKRSAWREGHAQLDGDGEGWRSTLLDSVAASAEDIGEILAAFEQNPRLGVVADDESLLGPAHWGSNQQAAAALLRRLELGLDSEALRFAAGSIYWIRGFVLQGLRALRLSPEDFEEEAGQIDGTTAHALERVIGLLAGEAGFELAGRRQLPAASGPASAEHWTSRERRPRARAIPFYLPQFHAFRENDLWWGEGFTEWSNVAAATPVYPGQRQPLLPGALGYYDLTTPGVRSRQYDEARAAGVEGFMYYYYWFAGRRLMDGPIRALHESEDEHPFCVMWANENWTRRWDGRDEDVLVAQEYDAAPAERFIEDVAELLRDPRYIRVEGRPLVAVYRIAQIPDFPAVVEAWREHARRAGIGELFILAGALDAEYDGIEGGSPADGLDGVFQFPPHGLPPFPLLDLGLGLDPRFTGWIRDYRASADSAAALRPPLPEAVNPGVMVNFDNTARRPHSGMVFYGSNPYTFRRWVDAALTALESREPERRLLFVNAWNEWAESAVLEPSVPFGRTYLLALRSALLR